MTKINKVHPDSAVFLDNGVRVITHMGKTFPVSDCHNAALATREAGTVHCALCGTPDSNTTNTNNEKDQSMTTTATKKVPASKKVAPAKKKVGKAPGARKPQIEKVYADSVVKKDRDGLRYVIANTGKPMFVSDCHNGSVIASEDGAKCKACGAEQDANLIGTPNIATATRRTPAKKGARKAPASTSESASLSYDVIGEEVEYAKKIVASDIKAAKSKVDALVQKMPEFKNGWIAEWQGQTLHVFNSRDTYQFSLALKKAKAVTETPKKTPAKKAAATSNGSTVSVGSKPADFIGKVVIVRFKNGESQTGKIVKDGAKFKVGKYGAPFAPQAVDKVVSGTISK